MNLLEIVGRGFKSWAADAKPEEIGGVLQDLREGDAAKDASVVGTSLAPLDFSAAINAAVDAKLKEISAAKDAEEKKEKEDEEAAKDAEKECESMADSDEEEAAKDDAEVIPSMSESIFSVGDAAKHLGALRSVVAKSKDKGVIDSYNKLAKSIKTLRTGVKDSAPDPFAALTKPSNSAVADAEPEIPMFKFFNGVPYEEGLKRWNAYQQSKGAR